MKHSLFHSSLSLSTPSRAIMYDEALSLAQQQDTKVTLLYCGGAMTQCAINICGDRGLCSLCKSYYRNERRRFGKRIDFVPFHQLISNEELQNIRRLTFSYANISEITPLTYQGINIGYGVVSGYISRSRNLAPCIDEQARIFFDAALQNAAIAVAAEQAAITQFRPDSVYLYNGRFSDSRPMLEIARQNGLPYTTLEAIYGIYQNFRAKYENSTPFSITYITEQITDFWTNDSVAEQDKIQIGESFFLRRRNAQYSGAEIYVANQQQGLLPDDWDASKHNIVIFNNSEDEFAAIGGEYEQHALFESQLIGLRYLKQQLAQHENIHVTLRIHPNLSNITYSYVQELYKLQDERFTVIPGDSPISTYSLLDAADTVVVFSSMMGAESVFWGKPTVLLAGALYYNLDICYIPKTPEELLELLLKPLPPKNRQGAVQFGYYLMNEEWERPKILDFGWEMWNVRVLGRTFRLELNNWQRFMGSRKAYAILLGVRRVVLRLINKLYPNNGCRYILPRKEALM